MPEFEITGYFTDLGFFNEYFEINLKSAIFIRSWNFPKWIHELIADKNWWFLQTVVENYRWESEKETANFIKKLLKKSWISIKDKRNNVANFFNSLRKGVEKFVNWYEKMSRIFSIGLSQNYLECRQMILVKSQFRQMVAKERDRFKDVDFATIANDRDKNMYFVKGFGNPSPQISSKGCGKIKQISSKDPRKKTRISLKNRAKETPICSKDCCQKREFHQRIAINFLKFGSKKCGFRKKNRDRKTWISLNFTALD